MNITNNELLIAYELVRIEANRLRRDNPGCPYEPGSWAARIAELDRKLTAATIPARS